MNKKETMIPIKASLSPNTHIYNDNLYTSGYVKDLKEQIEELQQRIDKAIEFLKQWGEEPDADMYLQIKEYKEWKDLLDILRGEE